MKTYKQFLLEFGPNCPDQTEPVNDKQASSFIALWKQTVKKFFGATFDFSNHFVKDRLNHRRNYRQISTCELTFVFNKFFVKFAKQFKKDVEDVKAGRVKPRGKNKHLLKHNELEFVITSKSTDINVVFVLKQDFGQKNTAIMLPITVYRKKGFVVNKGEHIIVENEQYEKESLFEVD